MKSWLHFVFVVILTVACVPGLGVRMGMGALGEAAMRTVGLGSSASAHPAVTPVRDPCYGQR